MPADFSPISKHLEFDPYYEHQNNTGGRRTMCTVRSPGFPDTNGWPTAGHSSANQVSPRKREGAKSNKTLEDE